MVGYLHSQYELGIITQKVFKENKFDSRYKIHSILLNEKVSSSFYSFRW